MDIIVGCWILFCAFKILAFQKWFYFVGFFFFHLVAYTSSKWIMYFLIINSKINPSGFNGAYFPITVHIGLHLNTGSCFVLNQTISLWSLAWYAVTSNEFQGLSYISFPVLLSQMCLPGNAILWTWGPFAYKACSTSRLSTPPPLYSGRSNL